jgi:hypothetical protein
MPRIRVKTKNPLLADLEYHFIYKVMARKEEKAQRIPPQFCGACPNPLNKSLSRSIAGGSRPNPKSSIY